MHLNKKIFFITLFVIVLGFIIPALALVPIEFINPLRYAEFEEIVEGVIDFIFDITIVVAPILALIAGFFFLTAAGNPEQLKKARDILIYTAIGLVVVIFARGLIGIIEHLFWD